MGIDSHFDFHSRFFSILLCRNILNNEAAYSKKKSTISEPNLNLSCRQRLRKTATPKFHFLYRVRLKSFSVYQKHNLLKQTHKYTVYLQHLGLVLKCHETFQGKGTLVTFYLTLLTQTLCETQTSHPHLLLPHFTGEYTLNMKIPSIRLMISSTCLILIL